LLQRRKALYTFRGTTLVHSLWNTLIGYRYIPSAVSGGTRLYLLGLKPFSANHSEASSKSLTLLTCTNRKLSGKGSKFTTPLQRVKSFFNYYKFSTLKSLCQPIFYLSSFFIMLGDGSLYVLGFLITSLKTTNITIHKRPAQYPLL